MQYLVPLFRRFSSHSAFIFKMLKGFNRTIGISAQPTNRSFFDSSQEGRVTPAELNITILASSESSPLKNFAIAGTPTASIVFEGVNANPNTFFSWTIHEFSRLSVKPEAAHTAESHPSKHAVISSSFPKSHFNTNNFSSSIGSFSLAFSTSLTRATTSTPRSSNPFTTNEPVRPVAPATATFLGTAMAYANPSLKKTDDARINTARINLSIIPIS
mmetsp:Transcript_7127/g.9254  ORF Transcript_7127/g.9254 Transcript_7127/m.9254 type:complete len:216 (-) Transcript_7127:110-757(-)